MVILISFTHLKKQKNMKPSQKLLTADNHVLVLIDYEGQMAFAVESILISALRTNAGIVAGASKIFNVSTVVTTVLESAFSGPVFPEVLEFYPKATSNYLDRSNMNMWEDTAAQGAVAKTKKKKIVLAGLWTSVCIADPALSALDDGYEVYFITDACGDVSKEAHERAVSRIIQAGGQPMTAVQYILELQRDWARNETYAAVTDLMKRFGGGYGTGIDYAHKMLKH